MSGTARSTTKRTTSTKSTKSTTLSARAINRATLARQLLLARAPLGIEETIDRLVGLQAQQPRPPFVGLWTRLVDFTPEMLRAAITARRVIRVTFVRGTLHLVTAADYQRVRRTIQPMLTRGMMSIVRGRTEAPPLDEVVAMGAKFFGKRAANFESFREEVAAKYPDHDVRALAYGARLTVPLVQVPDESRWMWSPDPEFTTSARWLGAPVHPRGIDATELLMRYLAAFGPATPGDFTAWCAMPGAKALFASVRDRLVSLRDADGRELFDLPDAPRPDEDTPAPIRLLPEFDNLVLSHDDRSRVIDAEHRNIVVTKNGIVRATVLVDGRVAATWTVERKAKSATFVVSPLVRLSKRTLADLEPEGDAVLRFLEPDAPARTMRVDAD